MLKLQDLRKHLLIQIFLLLSCAQLLAQAPVVINNKSTYHNLVPLATWWKDDGAKATVTDAEIAFEHGYFINNPSSIASYGMTGAALWMHAFIQNSTGEKTYLIFENPNIDSIDVYRKHGDHYQLTRLGSRALPDVNLFTAPLYSYTIPASADAQEIWVRAVTHTSMLLPIAAGGSDAVLDHFLIRFTIEGFFAGIVFALFLYNFCLFIWTRDRNYGYYIGYVFCLGIYVLFYIRGFSHFLGEDISQFMHRHAYTLAAGGNLFALLFTYSFLKVKTYAPAMVGLLKSYAVFLVAYMVLDAIMLNKYTVLLIQMVGFTLPLVVLVTAIKVYKKIYRPAIFFLIAWGFLLAGVLLYTATISNLMPAKPWTFHFISIGASVEMILLSLALGYRIVLLEKEKNLLQENSLKLVQSQKNLLEEKVNERTLALQESNQVKDKILGIIAHDVRTPFITLENLLYALDNEMINKEDSKFVFEKIRLNTKSLSGSLNNLLNWSLSQMNMIKTNKERVNLFEIISSVAGLYTETAAGKNIQVIIESEENVFVMADQDQLRLICRNLLENAIKFSYLGGKVKIGSRKNPLPGYIDIYVSDEGKGITNEHAKSLFEKNHFHSEYGTANEKGTGLGLQLSYEFAALNGAELKVSTAEGKGTEFFFALPLAPGV